MEDLTKGMNEALDALAFPEGKKGELSSVSSKRGSSRRRITRTINTESAEILEERQMLSAVVPATVVDNFDSGITDNWTFEGNASIVNGEVHLKNVANMVSKESFVPTAENPLIIQADVELSNSSPYDYVRIHTRSGSHPKEEVMFQIGTYGRVEIRDRLNRKGRDVISKNMNVPAGKYHIELSDNGRNVSIRMVKVDDPSVILLAKGVSNVKGDSEGKVKIYIYKDGKVDNVEVGYEDKLSKTNSPAITQKNEEVSIPADLKSITTNKKENVIETVVKSVSEPALNAIQQKSTIVAPKKLNTMSSEEIIKQMKSNELERNNAESIVKQIGDQITKIEKQIVELETEIAKLETELENGPQKGEVIYFAKRGGWRLQVNYSNLPEGTLVEILNKGRSILKKELPLENNRTYYKLPIIRGISKYMECRLIDPDGNVIEGSQNRYIQLANIAIRGIPARPKTLNVGEEWNEQALIAEKEQAEKSLAELKELLSEQQLDIVAGVVNMQEKQDILKESIPYTAMQIMGITGGDNHDRKVEIRYMTNEDSITFRIVDHTNTWETTVNHTGGMADGLAKLKIPYQHMQALRGTGKPYVIKAFNANGELLDQSTIMSDGSFRTNQRDIHNLEMGRTVENPIESRIKYANVQGPTVLFALSSNRDASKVFFEDAKGSLSSRVYEHSGGIALKMGKVTIGSENSSGKYALIQADINGVELNRIEFVWNSEEKTLTPVDGTDHQWSPELQVIEAIARGNEGIRGLSDNLANAQATALMFETQANIDGINMNSNVFLRNLKKIDLYAFAPSEFRLENDEVLDLVRARYPQADNVTISRTAGSICEVLGEWDHAVGSILESAVDIYRGIEDGENENELNETLERVITRQNSLRDVISIMKDTGKRLPTFNEAKRIGKEIYDKQEALDVLSFRESEFNRLHMISEMRAGMASWQEDRLGQTKKVSKGPSGNAENGYMGVMSEGESKRLARAVRRSASYIMIAKDPRVLALIASREGTDGVTVSKRNSIENVVRTIQTEKSNDNSDELDGVVVSVSEKIASIQSAIDFIVGGMRIEGIKPQNIGVIENEFDGVKEIKVPANNFVQSQFTLNQDSMVNLWVNQNDISVIGTGELFNKNIDISLSGEKINGEYVSNNPTGAGESISSVLPAGTYTLTITDNTDYTSETLLNKDEISRLLLNVSVGINIKPYTTQKIEGRISIPESRETMDVSMGVAEFEPREDGTWRRKESDEVSSLNHNKPVWVGIHGMNGHEDDSRIDGIAQELYAYGDQAGQVVTINWEIAAQDITRTGQDAPWTKAVGEWVGQQIVAAGFSPDKVHFFGHSHGTYVSFSAAKEIMRLKDGLQVNTIVALDPAGNVPALSGFQDKDIRFDAVSRNSIAIEGSWIAGSNKLASTADIAFQIDSKDTYTPWKEHGLPITTFASILHNERLMPGQYPNALTLKSLMTPVSQQSNQIEHNTFRDIYEGIITIDTRVVTGKYGNYIEAIPRKIEWGNLNSDLNNISYINNVDANITKP